MAAPREFAELTATLLSTCNELRFQVHGQSMFPFVRDGDIAVVARIDPRALALGDVLACTTAGGGLLIHRLVRIVARPGQELLLITRGDARRVADAPCVAAQIQGRVIRVERDGVARVLAGWRSRWPAALWRLGFPVPQLALAMARRLKLLGRA